MESLKLSVIMILLIFCLGSIIFQSYEIASLKLNMLGAIRYHLQMPTDVWSAYPQADQSGAIILVMLKAHAYAYAKNLRYRGLCYDENQGRALPSARRAKIHKQLAACLKRLNVPTVLNLSCPDEYVKNRTLIVDSSVDKRILNLNLYNSYKYFTKEWVSAIRSQRPVQDQDHHSDYKVALHLRRGDITPCNDLLNFRYNPNSFALELLDKYIPKSVTSVANVTIFSQSDTVEPFKDFRERGYNLALDTDFGDTWEEMMDADLFIMGESTFSLIPGIFSRGKVVSIQWRNRKFQTSHVWNRYFPHFTQELMPSSQIYRLHNLTVAIAEKYCNKSLG